MHSMVLDERRSLLRLQIWRVRSHMTTRWIWVCGAFCAVLAVVSSGCKAASSAEEEDAREAVALLQKAYQASTHGDSEQAIKDAGLAIKKDPELADAYYIRGRELVLVGRAREAVTDLDRYVSLRPQDELRQWERGIACYYAEQYAKGAQQFQLYQTYDDGDVENAVWHFLCVARHRGLEAARKELMPVENDPRIPLMEVYRLFQGKLQPEEVLAAARANDPAPEILASHLFYAHLYLGLYYDAVQQPELAREHLKEAIRPLPANSPASRYMWRVARVHAQSLAADASDSSNRPESAECAEKDAAEAGGGEPTPLLEDKEL